MTISIAMAAYNGSQHIREQLASFQKQTLPPTELVVADDDSTDGTVRIVEEFAREAAFEVRILRNKTRVGYRRNFERALSACRGNIIFLSDQDDVWAPEKIATIHSLFEHQPQYHCILNDLIITDAKLRPIGVTLLENILRLHGSDDHFIPGCGTAITRAWRDFVLPFPEDTLGDACAHDSWISHLAKRARTRYVYPNALQSYRRHDANTSNSELNLTQTKRRVLHPDFWAWLAGNAPHNLEMSRKELEIYRSRFESGLARNDLEIDRSILLRGKDSLDAQIDFIGKRAGLLNLPPHKRVLPIIGLLLSGQYGLAAGALSAAKDLLGPRLRPMAGHPREKET